jgi:predicted nucleic acid-binding protein
MKKVFMDSDVILDALLKRAGFNLPAMNIINLAYELKLKIVTSAVVFVNVHYFLDKYDRANKFQLLKRLRSVISILEVGEPAIDLALKSGLDDFEDAVQYYTALTANVDVIITRNIKDYKHSTLPVLTPTQFLGTL